LLKLSRIAVFMACVLASYARDAAAVAYNVATTGGVLQQPSSHYYHAIYGGQGGFNLDSEALHVRFGYFERPEFKAVGYIDKDYGYHALIGTKVTKTKDHGLRAFVGFGRVEGYVRVDKTQIATSGASERTYAINGPIAAIEYAWRWKHLEGAVGHQSFTGYAGKDQTEARVAWPYNIFQMSLGTYF